MEYRAQGVTILLSSHLLDQVERLCHRMAIVYGGRIAALGTLEELKQERAQGGTLEDVFFAVTSADRDGGAAR